MSQRRSMLPKEHGAYAALAFPLITALLHAHVGALVIALGLVAIALFIAHEPALVLLGSRSLRARREHSRRARWWLAGLLGCALGLVLWVAASAQLALRPAEVLRAAAVPALLFIGMIPVVLRQQQKSLTGELLATATLCAASVPIAVAGAVAIRTTALLASVWWLSFTVGILAVRGVTRRKEGGQGRSMVAASLVVGAASVALAASLAAAGWLPWWPTWGLLPTVAFALGVALVGAAPSQLRRVGWLLAATSMVTLVLLSPALTQLG